MTVWDTAIPRGQYRDKASSEEMWEPDVLSREDGLLVYSVWPAQLAKTREGCNGPVHLLIAPWSQIPKREQVMWVGVVPIQSQLPVREKEKNHLPLTPLCSLSVLNMLNTARSHTCQHKQWRTGLKPLTDESAVTRTCISSCLSIHKKQLKVPFRKLSTGGKCSFKISLW